LNNSNRKGSSKKSNATNAAPKLNVAIASPANPKLEIAII
jgi:hypothetical protein